MKYKLKAYNIYQLGKRTNQEDSIFPKFGEVGDDDRLFVLCDGMGGHESGEVASAAVCEAMSKSVLAAMKDDQEGEFTDEMFQDALAAAYDSLDAKDNGAAKKMGTTMTFLKLHKNGCTIAHIGDSRVYHIRPGKNGESTQILFQTEDHSLINNLIKIGELTPEEAKTSKQKNVITRAMQPNMEKRSKADIHHITDIKPGDFFYMCTDGMLEEMDDDNIRFIFSDVQKTDERKVEVLLNGTKGNSDNHSAFIIHIIDVEGEAALPVKNAVDEEAGSEKKDGDNNEQEQDKVNAMPVPVRRPKAEKNEENKKNEGKSKKIIWVVILVVLCALAAYGVYTLIMGQIANQEENVKIIVKPEDNTGSNINVNSQGGNMSGKDEVKIERELEENNVTDEEDDDELQDENEIKDNKLNQSSDNNKVQSPKVNGNKQNQPESGKNNVENNSTGDEKKIQIQSV